MNLEYESFEGYEPTAVSWRHGGERVLLAFPFPIRAVYSGALDRVVVELSAFEKLGFHHLDGSIDFESDIPELPGYQFWGLNQNRSSTTAVALLFQPVADDVGNEWRDTEQYELVLDSENIVGKKLGIYR